MKIVVQTRVGKPPPLLLSRHISISSQPSEPMGVGEVFLFAIVYFPLQSVLSIFPHYIFHSFSSPSQTPSSDTNTNSDPQEDTSTIEADEIISDHETVSVISESSLDECGSVGGLLKERTSERGVMDDALAKQMVDMIKDWMKNRFKKYSRRRDH
ncbi:hypothetical protein D9758_016287 [Tetrapyrgos nigripes]|uniref:Uncharacterized protein n=1 Tax=Tetrapyrgos nigripes TaxID=182062 RepID=A0A8H5CBN6_9AGAR|nr:hypothetical protein D9758_016287 [Tetrapyrgos nigripes]